MNIKMTETIDATGIITKALNESCVVSVSIDGSSKLFLFNKTIFYTFGVQCDGNMTNIVEEGMEVELRYKISHPGRKLCIVAVWLGDKPDCSTEDVKETLKAIYDKNGCVSYVDSDHFLVQDDEIAVLITKDVVFRDGSPLKDAVSVNEEISFDAIPLEMEHPSGASYQATCAWIGSKPSLVDRFSLRSFQDNPKISIEEVVQGTVTVIPNDVVALVEVEFGSVSMNVLLFRDSFNQRYKRVQDLVCVGDSVCMRLAFACIFPGRRQWYGVKAFKTSDEICLDDVANICEETEDVAVKTTEVTPSSNSMEESVLTENSEILISSPPLYGVISWLVDAQAACISYGGLKIFLHHDNFYMNKKPCSVGDFQCVAFPGTNSVYFEAILTKFSGLKKSEFTHEATCAWTIRTGYGRRPGLLINMSPLPPSKMSLLEDEGQIFYGGVSKFRLPDKAYVVISGEFTTVIVDVSSFICPPQYPSDSDPKKNYIFNFVKLNDYVQFKVTTNEVSPKLLWAYDVQPALFTKDTREKINSGISVSRKLCENRAPSQKHPYKASAAGSAPSKAVLNDAGEVPTKAVCVSSVSHGPGVTPLSSIPSVKRFTNSCLSQGRGFLLNCSGILRVKNKIEVSIEHVFGNTGTLVNRSDISLDSDAALKLDNRKVRFDAEFVMSPNTNSGFQIVRMWDEHYGRPEAERLLISELAIPDNEDTFPSIILGKVKSIPFHDCAIATFNNIPALVTLESLVTVEEVNPLTSFIETFLNVGDDIVGMDFKKLKVPVEGMSCYRATRCLKSHGHCSSLHDVTFAPHQINISFPEYTRLNVWGLGECYRKEIIRFRDNGYFVDFVSSKRPGLRLSLNLFEKKKVFINGELANPNMLKDYVGSTITFHVAHVHSENQSSSGDGMYVACAWIGDEPPPELICEEFSVPKNSVRPNWRYEAVVASFPLPSFALCFINHAPVLVEVVSPTKGDVIEDLKKGDRVVVGVFEKPVGDFVVLLSKDLLNLKRAREVEVRDVFRNLTGTITALPEPLGKIKVAGADIEVVFELCHLLRFRKRAKSTRKWFAAIRSKIFIGQQVYFSATITKNKNAQYRVFEVYFIE